MNEFSHNPGTVARRPGQSVRPNVQSRDPERAPSLVVIGAAVLTFVIGVANFALGQVSLGVDAITVGLLIFGGGLSWLAMERRRIREAERAPFMQGPSSQSAR